MLSEAKVYARNAGLVPPRYRQHQCCAGGFKRSGEISAGNVRQNQDMERRFVSIETEMASGKMVEQVKVRQQMHGEIAAKRGVAVAAVTADAGDLDRALIELDVVALMSFGR